MATAIPPPPPSSGAQMGGGAGVGGGSGGGGDAAQRDSGRVRAQEQPHDPFMEGMPARFGKYTLIRKLATGGMAELFLAIQKSVAGFEKLLVIKRILPAMNNDRAFIDMLLHEARIAATLSHPNIVQIFDVGQHHDNYYIAMEHVHGEDLRQIVRQMKKKGVTEFPLEHAISIILGICSGLAYAHERRDLDGSALNIVHRDISPQNVVVTFTGDVKVVDFGIAKSDTKMTQDTRSGKLKGKIPYMSPEQARGENIDLKSDIFAAGVMLFELTTGKRLFKGNSEFETLKLICEREYPRPSQVRPGYPQELEHIVMRALAKDPGGRYQSAREMQAALEEFVRRERIPTSTIALSQFMQSLFEEKLATQKELLLQGKQLADIIALQPNPDSTAEVEAMRQSGSTYSMPAAAHTVTGVAAAPKSKTGIVLGSMIAAAALLGGGAIATVMLMKAKPDTTTSAAGDGAGTQAAATTVQAPAIRGAIAIASDPPGATIWLNGEKRPEVTPATLTKLAIGAPLEIKLGKEGFEESTQTIILTDQDSSSAISATLKKGTCGVEVSVRPHVPGIAMMVDRKIYNGLSVDGLSSGEQHTMVVFAPGYVGQQITFTANGSEKKHFDVLLVKEKDKAKETETDPTKPPTPPPPATTAAPAAAGGGTGRLSVGARGGWCNVAVDGVGRGPTPVVITVSAGSHSISCTTEAGKTLGGGATVPADGKAGYVFSIPQ